MTELEIIARDILSLKRLLRVAWETLGLKTISPLERVKTREQMQKAASDLRRALQDFQHEHARLRRIGAEAVEKRAPPRVKLRLIDIGNPIVFDDEIPAIMAQMNQRADANAAPDTGN